MQTEAVVSVTAAHLWCVPGVRPRSGSRRLQRRFGSATGRTSACGSDSQHFPCSKSRRESPNINLFVSILDVYLVELHPKIITWYSHECNLFICWINASIFTHNLSILNLYFMPFSCHVPLKCRDFYFYIDLPMKALLRSTCMSHNQSLTYEKQKHFLVTVLTLSVDRTRDSLFV